MKTRVCLYGASNTGKTTQPDCRQRNDQQSFAPRCEANAASVFHLIMKRLFFLFAALLSCLSSMAEIVEIDGGWYSIDEESHTAVFTGLVTSQYTFSIPSSIVVEGQSYSVTTIGGGAFYGCSSLTEIEIPNSVTEIGAYAFYVCSSLAEIEIPSGVTEIGGGAFFGCSSLAKIEIPSGVTTIGDYAFRGCSSLAEIEIPNSVTELGGGAFFGCSSLTSLSVAEENPNYTSRDNVIYTKDMKTLVCCSHSKEGVFSIPNSVTTIVDYAFYGCSSLAEIEIPNSVTTIGDYAFLGCSSLTSLSVAEENPNYTSRDNVIYTKDMKTLVCCSNSKEGVFSIPNDVTEIGDYAFSDCSNLTEIEIPSGVTEIGGGAFYGCSSLAEIKIPNSVTTIGYSAFEGCSSLAEIEIPNSVTEIGDYAFFGCSSLAKIEIPNSVTTIGYSAFEGCSSLAEIEIPNSVTEIGDYAFFGCSSLAKIEIPNSVTTIGYSAFEGCSSLTEIEIPNSVTTIGNYAFSGCSSLATIVSYSVTPQSSSDPESVFNLVPNTATIIIPKGSKAAYEASPLWSQFTNFEESDDKTPTAMKDIKNLDGITVQNGTIIGCDNMRIYNMMGQDVTSQNGSLRGIFIVRVGEETTKVMVK